MSKKIIYLISFNYPPMARTHSRYYFAKFLAENGYTVKVIKSDHLDGFLQKQTKDETITNPHESISEYSIKHTNYSIFADALEYFSYWPENCYNWVKQGLKLADQIIPEKGIIFSIYPNLSSILLGYQLSLLKNMPWVIDYRDEMLDLLYPPQAKQRDYYLKQEANWLKHAQLISVSTPAIKENLMTRYQLSGEKITVTWNGFEEIEPENKDYDPKKLPIKFIYTGAISKHQKPEILAQAVHTITQDDMQLKEKIEVNYFGPDKPYYYTHLKAHIRDNVHYRGFVPFQIANEELKKSTVAFLSLADEKYAYAIPRKLFEYINLEIPILAVLPDGEAKDIIEKNHLGFVSLPGESSKLRSTILELIKNPQRLMEIHHNLKSIKNSFCFREQVKTLCLKLAKEDQTCVA